MLGQRSDGAEIFVGYTDQFAGTLADRMVALVVGRAPAVDRATGRLVGLVVRRDLLQVPTHATRLERESEQLFKFPS